MVSWHKRKWYYYMSVRLYSPLVENCLVWTPVQFYTGFHIVLFGSELLYINMSTLSNTSGEGAKNGNCSLFIRTTPSCSITTGNPSSQPEWTLDISHNMLLISNQFCIVIPAIKCSHLSSGYHSSSVLVQWCLCKSSKGISREANGKSRPTSQNESSHHWVTMPIGSSWGT